MNTAIKALLGLLFGVAFFGGMSYIPDPYGTYIWQGGALGSLTCLAMFVVGAPIAFMMNNVAYKPFLPRLIMGFLGAVLFPVVLIYMFFRPKTYYFGLMPLMEGCDSVGGNSLLDYLKAIWCTVIAPFTFHKDDPADLTHLTELIGRAAGYIEGADMLPASILDQARTVAGMRDGSEWQQAYTNLVTNIQGSSVSKPPSIDL